MAGVRICIGLYVLVQTNIEQVSKILAYAFVLVCMCFYKHGTSQLGWDVLVPSTSDGEQAYLVT